MRRVVSIVALVVIVAAIPLVRQYKAAHAPVAEMRDVDEGTPSERAAKRAAILADIGAPSSTHADGTKVGGFETTFVERSPLSAPAELARRLRLDATPADYDLAKLPFLVYVPESYDRRRPMGLVVLVNYKRSTELPFTVLPQLAAANVAFAVSKELPNPWPTRAGLALDAVHNLQRQYAIDPHRIYVFGGFDTEGPGAENPAFTGLRLGLDYPDVFAGCFAHEFPSFHAVRAGNGGSYEFKPLTVDASQVAEAKRRPLVLSTQRPSEFNDRTVAAYRADGFAHLLYVPLTVEQFHYPRYTTDWLPAVLRFMDEANAKPPTTQTSSAAAR